MSMATFTIHEAKTNLSRLIAAVLAGHDVVIARGATPVVRLVPVASLGKRQFGALKGKIAIDARFNEPLPDSELRSWEDV
jgi:prevent-host-death family protein